LASRAASIGGIINWKDFRRGAACAQSFGECQSPSKLQSRIILGVRRHAPTQSTEQQGMTMDSTKTIQVNIPPEIQKNIDTGEYSIKGSVVRDKLGRFVSHLDSLEVDDEHYFSPSIFVSIQSYAITSVSTVSIRLQNYLKELRTANTSINGKLDRLLGNQTNNLIASITNFESHFNSLMKKSSLSDEKGTFAAGTKAASELAAHIPDYIKDYLGETIVFHRKEEYYGEKYSAYLSTNSEFVPQITKRKFSNFINSEAYYFVYSFINIINNINVLSLCYDFTAFPEYEENLQQIRTQMVDLLSKIIKGLGGEGDIFGMCYTMNQNKMSHHITNIETLTKYTNINIHDLIQRNFAHGSNFDYDIDRVNSMYAIVRIIEDIDNLLKRKEQFSDLKLDELPELEQLKKLTFGK
jgi:hypothetical protein